MTRIKGNTLPTLTFKNGAASLVSLGLELTNVEFTDGDGNQVTFADYNAGAVPVQMNCTWVLDFAATSAYEYHWQNAGVAGVAYTFTPASGAVSQLNPKFSGTLTMPPRPRFALEAGDATNVATFETTYALDAWDKAVS